MGKTGPVGEVTDLPDDLPAYGVGYLGVEGSICRLRPAFGGKDREGRHQIKEATLH